MFIFVFLSYYSTFIIYIWVPGHTSPFIRVSPGAPSLLPCYRNIMTFVSFLLNKVNWIELKSSKYISIYYLWTSSMVSPFISTRCMCHDYNYSLQVANCSGSSIWCLARFPNWQTEFLLTVSLKGLLRDHLVKAPSISFKFEISGFMISSHM